MADFLLIFLLVFGFIFLLINHDKEQNLQRNQLTAHGLT